LNKPWVAITATIHSR